MIIRFFHTGDEKAVIELWRKCNLLRPWNNPELDIQRKLKVDPDLFLVGLIKNRIIASVIGGYEGHRGWINYLAVDPEYQKKGIGKQLMKNIEKLIEDKGCPKINLQIRQDNDTAVQFYKKLGYETEEIISMGKRFVKD